MKNTTELPEPINYEALAEAYDAAGWNWRFRDFTRPPKASELSDTIERLKTAAESDGGFCGTGGIEVAHDAGKFTIAIHNKIARHMPLSTWEKDAA